MAIDPLFLIHFGNNNNAIKEKNEILQYMGMKVFSLI